ncbi:lipoprotein-releasing system permease protein [Gillisia sp. Hel1_33_143]|uniref:ABC transporter permease n=1 Tax=Gillisia sp. Hel1_33_143 TaxID=1336796 RepID=UPI0008796721|nr:FtsX-like permease family protein [Gillisia sp. Hel1_33_143]SDR87171.1 lipoprotein-releasing system permease protein [Gillisia sp. Hel1_33_143]
MNFSLYIAKRYLFTKSSSNAINIITIIAAIGIFAGTLALFVVLSGFSGLKDFSLSFTNEFDPDLKVLPSEGKIIQFTEKEKEDILKIEGIEGFTQTIEERVFLDYRSKNHTAYLKGVDSNYQRVNNVDSAMVYGTWLAQSEYQVVVGNGISKLLSISPFDYNNLLNIMVPKPGKGQIKLTNINSAFSRESVIVTGIYSINEELDNKFVFSNLMFARKLLDMKDDEISSLEFKTKPEADIDNISKKLEKIFGNNVEVKTRAQLNETLYKMLNTENLAVYLIFTLVLIIALFNVVGSIIMVILDKRENIKTLYNIGATPNSIKNIFFFQGTLMTVIGGVLGLIFGIVLVYLQLEFNFVMITPSLPYPVSIKAINILIVALTIGVLGISASYIAATRSKKALGI